LEVEWDEICWEPKVERLVPVYHKTDVLGLQAFLQEVQPMSWKWQLCRGDKKSYKDIIFEGIKHYVPKKILDPEYYNKEVKRLMVKVRKMYNKRKFGQSY
jgi:hypothetical protein